MTEMDDVQLSQRLRALRVDPPETGFEARLAERLRAMAPEPGLSEPAQPARREGRRARVIMGPWMRRGPVRLIGATALFVAGAAAAVDGGVVEWVQARVQAVRRPEPAPSPPASNIAERMDAPARRPRVERQTPAPVELPAPRTPDPAPLTEPAREPVPSVPRLMAERRIERVREAAPAPEQRPALEAPVVPRLEIDRLNRERASDPDTRLGRALAQPSGGVVARERGRDLERIRDIAKARREQAPKDERQPAIDRLRERRERINTERREIQERGRPDRRLR